MEIAQLEAFERAARTGSFTRAAAELGLTQPSISARIASLEAEIGGPLFERGSRRLRLTGLGQTLLPYAERVLAAIADGQQAVHSFRAGRLGKVIIAALEGMAAYMLPDAMGLFRQQYPAVDFTIKLRAPHEIVEMLYDGSATLGLTGAPLWDKGIRVCAHFQERVQAVVSAQHPLALRQETCGSLWLNEVYEYTIYRVSLNPVTTATVEAMVERGRRGSGGAVISIPEIMCVRLLLKGEGVAFLPERVVQGHVAAGRLTFLRIEDMPLLYDEPLLIAPAGRDIDTPNQAFIRMMRAQWQAILVDDPA